MVSINSCVEVDLQGQVCAEAIGLRQIPVSAVRWTCARRKPVQRRSVHYRAALHHRGRQALQDRGEPDRRRAGNDQPLRCKLYRHRVRRGAAARQNADASVHSSSSPSHTRSSARNLPRSTKSASVSSWKSRLPKRLLLIHMDLHRPDDSPIYPAQGNSPKFPLCHSKSFCTMLRKNSSRFSENSLYVHVSS